MANFTDKPKLDDRFEFALAKACQWHRTQVRKQDDTPYLAHLLAVSSLVLEAGGDQDAAIAALLHDSLEDAGISREDLEERFGESVAHMVSKLSMPPNVEPDKQRRIYILQVATSNPSVQLISAADSLHNLRSYSASGVELWNSVRAEYYKELVEVYKGCDRIPSHWITEFEKLLEFLSF